MSPSTTSRLSLQQPVGTDSVSEYRIAIFTNAAALDNAAIFNSGTIAARPAAGVAGRFYLATDTGVWSGDTGSKWVDFPTGVDTTVAAAHILTQTVSGNTTARLNINVSDFDPGNNLDTTTNYCYVVPVAGYYEVYGQIVWTSAAGAQTLIYRNGSLALNGDSATSATASIVSGVLQCAAGDKLDLRVQTASSSITTNTANMQIVRVA